MASPTTQYRLLPFVCVIGGTFRKETEEQAPRMEGAHRLTVLGIGGVHGGQVPTFEEGIFI